MQILRSNALQVHEIERRPVWLEHYELRESEEMMADGLGSPLNHVIRTMVCIGWDEMPLVGFKQISHLI